MPISTICGRIINEVQGSRCGLDDGHSGACRAEPTMVDSVEYTLRGEQIIHNFGRMVTIAEARDFVFEQLKS